MSRVGSVPILVPSSIMINNNDKEIEITYQSQSKNITIPKNIKFNLENNIIKLECIGDKELSTKDWGTFRQNLSNTIKGFVEGFSKKVFLVGTGFKAEVKGNVVRLYLGHSHPFYYFLPEGIKATYDKAANSITFIGNDKENLGNLVREIINLRKVEPYKGKGVRLEGQFIIRKESKTKK